MSKKRPFFEDEVRESIRRKNLMGFRFNPNSHILKGVGTPRLKKEKLERPKGPNSAPKSIRRQVFERDRVCQHCETEEDLTFDHIVPRSQYGCTCAGNQQLLCHSCNTRKASKPDKKGAIGHTKSDCPLNK